MSVFSKLTSMLGARTTDTHFIELLKGSSTALVLRMAGIGLAYLFVLLITRGFGAKAMGVFALVYTILQLGSVVGRLGLDTALVRFVADFTAKGKAGMVKDVYLKALRVSLPASIALAIAIFLWAPQLSEFIFRKPHLTPYFRISAVGLPFMVLVYLHAEGLRGLGRIKLYLLIFSPASFLFATAILGVMLFVWPNPQAPIGAYTGGLVLAAGLGTVLWWQVAGLHSTPRIRGIGTRELMSVSVPMLLASSMLLVMQWTDTIMLGMWRTESEVGIYNVAAKVANLTSLTLFAVNSVTGPKFAGLFAKRDFQGLRMAIQHATRLLFWTSTPVLVVILMLPSLILSIFGAAFTEGSTALVLLTLGQFINVLAGPAGLFLQMTGHHHIFQNTVAFASGINIVLNLILIPTYGIVGAAIASATSMALWNLISVSHIKRNFGIFIMYIPFLKNSNGSGRR